MSYYERNKSKWKLGYNATERYKEYHEEYYNQTKGKFIYFIYDKEDNLKYIGKTDNLIYRLNVHKVSAKKYEYNKEDYILYLDFSDNNITSQELGDLERYFIELYKPRLNFVCGEYDTNSVEILDRKTLVFYEWGYDKKRLTKHIAI